VDQEVHALAIPLQGLDGVFGGVGFRAFAPAPEHIDFRAQLDGEVDCVHRLLQGVGADARIIRGERAIAKDRVAEQIGGSHRDFEAGCLQRRLEVAHDLVCFTGRGVDRHQIIVVIVDAVSADFCQ